VSSSSYLAEAVELAAAEQHDALRELVEQLSSEQRAGLEQALLVVLFYVRDVAAGTGV
jgi:hypothetical protein